MKQIRPISDLRNKFTEIEKIVKNGQPVFLTKNGYGSMVVMSVEQYSKLNDCPETLFDNRKLIESIDIPSKLCMKLIFSPIPFYEKIEIYTNCVSGFINGQVACTWYYKDYNSIEIINSKLNSQYAQVVFLAGAELKNTNLRAGFYGSQNFINAYNDTNRIIFCYTGSNRDAIDQLIDSLGSKIRTAFEKYKKARR